jgi:phosphoribosylamine--glycine ligase
VGSQVLVVGSGAREHAIAWRLAGESGVRRVVVAPGNPGMGDVAIPLPTVAAVDAGALAEASERFEADVVVIGPEAPLVGGVADDLQARGIPVFGPGREAARLEGSKAWCREVCAAAGIPIADGAATDDPDEAVRLARDLGGAVAVKADGLAAGKGVVMCASTDEAERAIRSALVEGALGESGRRLVIERALEGRELSLIAICDPTACLALPAARDHKRLLDGDQGPNTGGMGAVSPPDDLDDEALSDLVERFHRPALAELARRGIAFRGALFAGLMLTADGPRLLEFNVRFGDPETQVQLPRLATQLGPLLAAAARDRLATASGSAGIQGARLPTLPTAAVGVVVAAPGYPSRPVSGGRIEGIGDARQSGGLVFAAGVASGDGGLVASGGRVLTVVGQGVDPDGAAEAAYRAVDQIRLPGAQVRRDIGRASALAHGGTR